MKIAYIINHDITTNDGITKKIFGQKEAWEKLGNEVEVYCTLVKEGNSTLEAKQYISTSPFRLRFKLQEALLSDLNVFSPDIVYFRYNTWSRTLSSILDKYKVVTELNTYDLGEFWSMFKTEKTLKSLLRYLGYKLLRDKVLSRVAGIIGVSKEIAYHPSNIKYHKLTISIPNGINLDNFKTVKKEIDNTSRKGLFFIGSPGALWHGIDIIEIMAKKLPEYDFHIVGMDGKDTSNLFWHGYLQKHEYIEILKKCHICIGSLALHRNEMYEACTLKVREYLAYGYPILLGYKDSAFLDKTEPNWLCTIDTEKEIDYEKIKKFIEENYEVIVLQNEIEYINTKNLEEQRVNFFERLGQS